MAALTGRDLLAVWEECQGLPPVECALTLASVVLPQSTWDELAGLTVGQRDGLLLELRESLFGPGMTVYEECPGCRQRLEFTLDARQLRAVAPAPPPAENTLSFQGIQVRYRLPSSADLAAVSALPSVESARDELLRRCVLEARDAQGPVRVADLPAQAVAALEDQMEADDPLAELRFDLSCPQCGHAWWALLDMGAFLWSEVTAQARRLLYEVHLLARRYGWREMDILGMSGRRRQYYLEMAV